METGLLEVYNGSPIQKNNNIGMQVGVLTTHSVKYENGVFSHSIHGNTVTLTPQHIIPTEITTIRCGTYNRMNNLKIKPL